MPPQIVSTSPEPLAVVPEFEGPVVFRFSERISERNVEGSVLVSPETGEVLVSRGRSEIRVRLEGGWRPGVMYRVLLAPGIRDLFGNERREPAELVFSTGPPITSTAVGGLVTDRITGRPATQAMIDATRREDSLRYTTVADSLAFFAFRHLPVGIYDMIAFVDLNRNRRRDASEPVALGVVAPLNSARDTLTLDLAVVPPDTTPPRLQRAEARDSLQVRLFSDDYLEPDRLESIQVRILTLPDSETVAGTPRLVEVDSFARLVQARADSLRAEQMRADSLRGDSARMEPARADPTAGRGVMVQRTGRSAGPPPGSAGPVNTLPPLGPLPYQEFVLIPAAPLPPGEYVVEVSGLMNLSGRSGGGSARFEVEPPRRPTRDTTARAGRVEGPGAGSVRPPVTVPAIFRPVGR